VAQEDCKGNKKMEKEAENHWDLTENTQAEGVH
jgi:hypothetical protein